MSVVERNAETKLRFTLIFQAQEGAEFYLIIFLRL